ncbi:MAG: hypothetical protein AAFP90_14375 [Planctomycetota bacterium]
MLYPVELGVLFLLAAMDANSETKIVTGVFGRKRPVGEVFFLRFLIHFLSHCRNGLVSCLWGSPRLGMCVVFERRVGKATVAVPDGPPQRTKVAGESVLRRAAKMKLPVVEEVTRSGGKERVTLVHYSWVCTDLPIA